MRFPTCNYPGCSSYALLLSEPPRCSRHITDLDGWYNNVWDTSVARKTWKRFISDRTMPIMQGSAHEIYIELVLQEHPSGMELYRDYKQRVDPNPDVCFSFDDTVYFAISAAVSGIIGNLAYDALKKILRHISRKSKRHEVETTFDEVIREEKYEELRISIHRGKHAQVDSEMRITKKVERRYHLIVSRGYRGMLRKAKKQQEVEGNIIRNKHNKA